MHVYVCGRAHTGVWGRQGRKRAWGAGQCLWSRTVLPPGSQGLSLEAGGLTDLVGIRWVLGKTVTPWVLGMGDGAPICGRSVGLHPSWCWGTAVGLGSG